MGVHPFEIIYGIYILPSEIPIITIILKFEAWCPVISSEDKFWTLNDQEVEGLGVVSIGGIEQVVNGYLLVWALITISTSLALSQVSNHVVG
jgi:hypothetical protein